MDLVTGATGHIGNVLIRELLKRGKKVRALILPNEDTASLNGLKVDIAIGNILNLDSLIKAFKDVDVVYHLASIISILSGNEKLIHQTNVVGTQNVIKACFKCKVKRLLYTSSIHALKEPPHGIIIDESQPFDSYNKRGEYDRSKAKASLEVLKAVDKGLDTVIICPTGVIGPYDFRISSIGQTIINFVNKKHRFIINGAYDYVDVRDVAVGHILVCDKGKSGEIYILSGQRINISNMMKMLEDITKVKAPHYIIPILLAKILATFAEIYYKLTKIKPIFTKYTINTLLSNSFISHKKASEELGYSPRPIKESIEDSINWFKEQGIL